MSVRRGILLRLFVATDDLNVANELAGAVASKARKFGGVQTRFRGEVRGGLPARSAADLRAHALAVGDLPPHHKDPFDRLLIAQAHIEAIPIISGDGAFDAHLIQRRW